MIRAADYLISSLRRVLLAAILAISIPAVALSGIHAANVTTHDAIVCSGGFGLVDVAFGDGDGGKAAAAPSRLFLDQNYPNPFNPSTMIRFGLPEGTHVKLTIHTLLGTPVKTVVDAYHDAGVYTLNLGASELASGVYFYRLETDLGTLTRRMTVSK